MNTLFFTTQNRRSLKTVRLNYGLEGMKYIIQVYEGDLVLDPFCWSMTTGKEATKFNRNFVGYDT